MSKKKKAEKSHENVVLSKEKVGYMDRTFIGKILLTTVIFIGAFYAISIVNPQGSASPSGFVVMPTSEENAVVLSTEQAREVVEKYVNENLLPVEGVNAEVTSATEFNDAFYLIEMDIKQEGEIVQSANAYASKDGTTLFLSEPLDLTQPLEQPEPPETVGLSCEDVPKEDSPTIEAFVVSYCPYGLQMQRALSSVVGLMGSENITVRYLGSVVDGTITAMHGEQEATENHRQICLREEQPEQFWGYLDCFLEAGEVESCLIEASIDTKELDACMADGERGVKYAQEDFDIAASYGTDETGNAIVSGSPSLMVNGEKLSEYDFAEENGFGQNGRAPENLKSLFCCAFNTAPAECSEVLSATQASTGFTPEEEGGTGSGSC